MKTIISSILLILSGLPAYSQNTTWYRDNDDDIFGDPSNSKVSVTKPTGYVRNKFDCNDSIGHTVRWDTVGNKNFSSANSTKIVGATDLAGNVYVAFTDLSAAKKISVMKYNGSSWATLGSWVDSSFIIGPGMELYIDNSGVPFIAYQAPNQVKVKKFNGNNWVIIGNTTPIAQNGRYEFTVDINGAFYVAYSDTLKASVMKFDGSNWVQVGKPRFTQGEVGQMSIKTDNSGTPYLVYVDKAIGERISVMKYNGSRWLFVGGQYIFNRNSQKTQYNY